MPIYEYRCEACEHLLEVLQKMSDAPLVTCPECGEDRLSKQLTVAGFQLKGSGWYETDFKGKKKDEPRKPAEGSAEKTSKAATSSKTSPSKEKAPGSAARADK